MAGGRSLQVPPARRRMALKKRSPVCAVQSQQVYPDQESPPKHNLPGNIFRKDRAGSFRRITWGLGVGLGPWRRFEKPVFYGVLLCYPINVSYIYALRRLCFSVQIYVLLFNGLRSFLCDSCVCMPRKRSSITGIIFWCTIRETLSQSHILRVLSNIWWWTSGRHIFFEKYLFLTFIYLN